jgi:transposase
MKRNRFRLTDAQFSKVTPYLPIGTPGQEGVDDRRVFSWIVQPPKSGDRRVNAPLE